MGMKGRGMRWCGWGLRPPLQAQKGTQRPRPWSERGHCVPRRSGPLQLLDSLVEERGDWTGSGALKPFKVTDPSHPTRSHVLEQAECWVGHLGWGGRHSPAPPTSIRCAEPRGDSEFLATWVLCWGGEWDSAPFAFFPSSAPAGPQHGENFRMEIFEGCNFTGQCLEFQDDCPFLQSRGWAKNCVNAVKVYGDGA